MSARAGSPPPSERLHVRAYTRAPVAAPFPHTHTSFAAPPAHMHASFLFSRSSPRPSLAPCILRGQTEPGSKAHLVVRKAHEMLTPPYTRREENLELELVREVRRR